MDVFLLRAIRVVIRADSDPVRQALFANLRQSSLPVRLAYALHERLAGTMGSSLLVSCYGLGFYFSVAPPANPRARVVLAARHANARRHAGRVASWVGPDECGWIRTRPGAPIGPSGGGLGLPARKRSVRAFRIVRRVDRWHGFLVSCRVAAAIAWYARARAIFGAHRPEAVVVSSDSNPEEVGVAAAARAAAIPTVFVAHAYPTPFSPPLDFSLSILEGEAAVQAHRLKGPLKGEVLLGGIEGESAPLDPSRFCRRNPVIGIFTPKAIAWPTLSAVIADCRQHFRARRIVIRWHPSMLEPPRLASLLGDLSGIVESPRTATLTEVARQCDWVVADENSGVHLPVLKLGIPTVAVKGLGLYPPSRSDMYGFAANRIVFPAVSSIRDVGVDQLTSFFAEGWAERFERYDASYLRPHQVIGDEVRRAISRLNESVASRLSCA